MSVQLTAERLRALLVYEPETGRFIGGQPIRTQPELSTLGLRQSPAYG